MTPPLIEQNVRGRVRHVPVTSHIRETLDVNQTLSACEVCGTALKRNAKLYCSIECYRVVQRSAPAEERFWSKVEKTDGCWLWTASTYSNGYGQFTTSAVPGRQAHHLAHRVAWEVSHGPVPEGMSVLHKCDVRRCVNPDHMFLGTQTDNMQDAAAKGRLHVPRPKRQKLTPEQVVEIRELDRSGMLRCEIAVRYDVSKTLISLILNGKRRQYDAPRGRRKVALAMSATYSDTTHGRFIEHMDLARAWAQWNGQTGTEKQTLRIMHRLDVETLRRMLAKRDACYRCDGDGFDGLHNCPRCGGGGKEQVGLTCSSTPWRCW